MVDRVALRRAAAAAQRLPASRRVVCVLEELGGQPPVPVPSPAWPHLERPGGRDRAAVPG